METKLFEIRDKATMLPALGVALSADDGALARSAGYGDRCILLTRLRGGDAHYDPYHWGDRTMAGAHLYIREHWDELRSGDVVDVRVALGEADEPVRSEFPYGGAGPR